MSIGKFQVGSTRKPGEGLRVGVIRYPPRGVERIDYAAEGYFDVWLPALAPSRHLMQDRKGRDPYDLTFWHSFFRRYEREMRKSTDARQAILLLAKLARRTHISIGCTCDDNNYCHVRVLEQLIQEAAASDGAGLGGRNRVCVAARARLTALCVYTIRHPDELSSLAGKRGRRELISERSWATGRELVHQALLKKQRVPIIFGDATDCSRIIYVGVLDDVAVDGNDTEYQVSHVRPVASGHKPQELVLDSTGRKIKPGFIRSYAICRTPDFLSPSYLRL